MKPNCTPSQGKTGQDRLDCHRYGSHECRNAGETMICDGAILVREQPDMS